VVADRIAIFKKSSLIFAYSNKEQLIMFTCYCCYLWLKRAIPGNGTVSLNLDPMYSSCDLEVNDLQDNLKVQTWQPNDCYRKIIYSCI